MERILKTPGEIVKVGRYSDRDTGNPVGFKSKVVSRRHCEFMWNGGTWWVKDVGSSSGTFLNSVRLSSPNSESRPHQCHDGDIVQLGMDFKGGEELIFRCVKIKLELNRDAKAVNQFK
jgi:E3 ubiquitin-protein ligase DMA1/2